VNEQTQVVSFDDVKAELGFDRFNSVLTEGWNIEPKRKPSCFIPPKDSPKVYITSKPEQYQQAHKTSEANFDIYEGAIIQRKDFTKYDQPLIDAIQNIIKNSEYTLTLRAVHYKLLNYGVKIQRDQHKYSNKPKNYAYLSVVATKMRVFGVIPFHN
jgi:hypothetical protein